MHVSISQCLAVSRDSFGDDKLDSRGPGTLDLVNLASTILMKKQKRK